MQKKAAAKKTRVAATREEVDSGLYRVSYVIHASDTSDHGAEGGELQR